MTGRCVIHDARTRRWLHFEAPQRTLAARTLPEVRPALQAVERAVREEGLYGAGFIAYEAAPAFDAALHARPAQGFPLLWFGLYAQPAARPLPAPRQATAAPEHWRPSVSRAEYDAAIACIKEHIAAGDTYQVNYTMRLRAPFAGDAWQLFLTLAEAQQADYGAFIDIGAYAVCSASPELFFTRDGRQLLSKPMKGTVRRGRTLAEDEAQARWLQQSEKNRAENVMIVDMVRNDLGRVATPGAVRVPRLFEVERYPTLWQMTSTVSAESNASLDDVMAALFPCASITGAPKARTMQIIHALETTPRRIYTGAIGFVAPQQRAQFSVAIRTVLVDREQGEAEYGVGGGIVWDSTSSDEYEECLLKARVLTARRPTFSLLETMLWSPAAGVFLLSDHLRRLADSAVYFGIPLDSGRAEQTVQAAVATLAPTAHRLRLTAAQDGALQCEATPFDPAGTAGPVRLRLAASPVNSAWPFLYHKTTDRRIYDEARSSRTDCDDVVLYNERGEITETTIANIVAEVDGQMLTPALACGLLPGVLRARLLEEGAVREAALTPDTLRRATALHVVNSLRLWRPAIFLD